MGKLRYCYFSLPLPRKKQRRGKGRGERGKKGQERAGEWRRNAVCYVRAYVRIYMGRVSVEGSVTVGQCTCTCQG